MEISDFSHLATPAKSNKIIEIIFTNKIPIIQYGLNLDSPIFLLRLGIRGAGAGCVFTVEKRGRFSVKT